MDLKQEKGMTYIQISKALNIPSKNVIRWCQNGVEKKMGGGRKILDPEMERKVFKWISLHYLPGSEIPLSAIKKKAIEFRSTYKFKGSRGWLKNFVTRYSISDEFNVNWTS